MELTAEKKGYKKTEVGWIPEDWGVLNVGDILKLKSGYAFSSKYYAEFGSILLTPGNFQLTGGLYFNDRNTKRYSGEYTLNQVLSKGDLVVVMTDLTPNCNLLGKPAVVTVDEPLLHNQRIGKVEVIKPCISEDFLYYYFLSSIYLEHIKNTSTGSTVSHTSNTSIYASKLLLPSTLEEQQAIAEALSDVDELIRSLDTLIEKKSNIKKGAMQELLTGKRRLPGFSGEWEVKKLGDVVDNIIGGGTPSRIVPEYWNGEIPWATVKDFSSFDKNKTKESITRSGLTNSASNLIPRKTLITSTRMALGEGVIYDVDVAINQDLKAVIPKKTLDTLFLFNWFVFNKQRVQELGSGSTVKGISLRDLKSLQIALPPSISEQKAIADVLSDMDNELRSLRQKRDKYRQIKQGMMQELLTGKTRLV